QKLTPVLIGTNHWTQLALGNTHTIAIKNDGSLWSWGNNATYQLGNGTTAINYFPMPVSCPGGVITNINEATATLHNVSIYPNPNNGTFTIHTPTNSTVVIYNMLGEIVYNNATNTITTPLALSLTTGVYVAKTISATGTSTTKFIVE
ncbi:MAG: T9SS type A sorting domain-containing protein, partial [Bacteroidia bacterium]